VYEIFNIGNARNFCLKCIPL